MSRIIKKYSIVFITMAFAFFLSASYVCAKEEDLTIRVGFPIQEGLTVIDEDGGYSGYTYDYLKEIAQYTGWTYEFVEAEGTIDEQIIALMSMLENGEIDLLGAMNYSEQLLEMYDFPSESYGNAYSVIAVKQDEDRIDEYNLTDYRGLRMALLSQAKNSNEKFYQYAKLNGIDYEVVWCDTDDEQYARIENGEADAMLSMDVSLKDTFRAVAKFSPVPFYFAITKGNTRVVNELNQAITYVSQINPTLQTNLYNKYFSRSSGQMILNSGEKDYIKDNPVLTVLVHDGFGPLQYYDTEGNVKGVARDLLDNIAEKAGMELEFLYTDTYAEYEEALIGKRADLILSIQYDYDTALKKDILLSNPYLETETVLVAHEGITASELKGKKRAVYKGDRAESEDTENVVFYDSIEESLQAVETGVCDFTYTNSYTATYYQRKNRQEHTVIYPQTGNDSMKYSIGILDKNAKLLSAILNKGINAVDPRELESYIYNNAQQDQDVTLESFIKDNPVAFVGSSLLILACILAFFYKYYRSQMQMKKQTELENTRYRYLSDILGEITFTYEYDRDLLIVSQEGVRIFQADEQIENYSSYPSKIRVKDRRFTLSGLLSQKQDMDVEMEMQPPAIESPEWYRVIIKVVRDGAKAVSAIGRIQNINEERTEREQLVQRSQLDGLTNILNSATMKKEIAKRLEQCRTPQALIIIDLDDFKEINDKYGHYTGDQVLVQTAEALKEVFREKAVVGRLGGDEFVVCIEYCGREHTEEKCHELFRSLESRRESSGYPIPTVSIGVAKSRENDGFTLLYQRADIILYEVKNTGKNDFRIEE